jgi:hypothetical protein
MKKLIVLVIAIGLLFSSIGLFAQEAKKKTITPKTKTETLEKKEEQKSKVESPDTKKKSGKPIKGRVVSLSKFILDKQGIVGKDEAIKEAEEGKPIVFLVGEGKKAKIYFVFNEDGSFAGKKLAKFAANKFVGIIGKTQIVNGINIIIAEMIESMD